MNDNMDFLTDSSKLYQKTTILQSTLCKTYGYEVKHKFNEIVKEIVKENEYGDTTCKARTNFEMVDISKELEQTNIDLSYNCYEKSDKSRFWDPIEPNVKKIRKDLPQLLKKVENGRYEIAKRVFES